MSFWERIQHDLKKNLQEGLDIFKEGSSVFTDKFEELTGEGKKKYQVFNLNMKVQEEFARLGGAIYDLTVKKSRNPLGNRDVKSILSRIRKMESEIEKLEGREEKAPAGTTKKKRVVKKKAAMKKKTAVKKKTSAAKSKKKKAVKKRTAAATVEEK